MFPRKLILPILLIGLALPLVGQTPDSNGLQIQNSRQIPPSPQGPGPRNGLRRRQGNGIDRIQKALNLTPDQASSLKSLIESRRANWEALAQEARQKANALREFQQQPNPNPTDLGNAMLAMRATQEKIRAARDEFMAMFRNLLTTDQRNILDGMKNFFGGIGPFRRPGLKGEFGGRRQ